MGIIEAIKQIERKEGYQEGYREGYQEGRKEIRFELKRNFVINLLSQTDLSVCRIAGIINTSNAFVERIAKEKGSR